MSSGLPAKQRNAVSRISGLVIANAMIFQEVLAESNPKVKTLETILEEENIQSELCSHWKFIIGQINYYPIFHIAREILLNVSSSKGFTEALRSLANSAQEIVGMRAALRHDLMGRIYHRLLVEKKYLGTYYTSIPAATLLLKLSLRPSAWSIKWQNLPDIKRLRIADLACGTGTLLMAAADCITDNYVSQAAAHGEKINTRKLQNMLAEKVIYGYDVLASAIHLTASTLALRAPEVAFTGMNLFSLPLGGLERRMGSIEYLIDRNVGMPHDLFGQHPLAKQVKGKSLGELPIAELPSVDLCVMNPPFTRSVGGNLLFGSLPEVERKKTQRELKKLIQYKNVSASITAGLGSVFVAVADPYIKNEGRIALVLPKALLSGVAWGRTRELIQKNYEVEYLVVSHDPERWNFSESTSLSEVLVVAKKVRRRDRNADHRTIAVNLWRNPTTVFEAQAISHAIISNVTPDLIGGQGALDISIGRRKVGEVLACPWSKLLAESTWMLPCGFSQSDLVRAAYHVTQGRLWIPGRGECGQIPLRRLEDLGRLGPDARDIHDGFRFTESPTPYPAFWGHDLSPNHSMAQRANRFLAPLPRAKPTRPLRKVEDLWPLAGRVLITERMRLNTQGLVAIRLTEPVLSSVWWSLALKAELQEPSFEKAMTLWFNSSIGLLLLLIYRLETEGAWVKLKKPLLQALPALDLQQLTSEQISLMASTYDRLCEQPLQPFPRMGSDPIRAEIDACIAEALYTADFSLIRNMLAKEPVVCLRKLCNDVAV